MSSTKLLLRAFDQLRTFIEGQPYRRVHYPLRAYVSSITASLKVVLQYVRCKSAMLISNLVSWSARGDIVVGLRAWSSGLKLAGMYLLSKIRVRIRHIIGNSLRPCICSLCCYSFMESFKSHSPWRWRTSFSPLFFVGFFFFSFRKFDNSWTVCYHHEFWFFKYYFE